MTWKFRISEFAVGGVFCLALYLSGIAAWLSDASLDVLFRLRGSIVPNQEIVIVGIDEESIRELSPWPFPRILHSQLLRRISSAKSIGFDLIFAEETAEDLFFINSIKNVKTPVTLAVARNYDEKLLLPPNAYKEHVRLGHVETLLGENGVVRKVELRKDGLPVFALAMLKNNNAQQASRIINFYGPEFTFVYVSYSDVIKEKIDLHFFDNRFVLVGSSALALGDVHVTPFSKRYPLPGVEVQATILSNILDNSFLRDWSGWSLLLSSIFFLSGWLVWIQLREIFNLILIPLCILSIWAVACYAFEHCIFFDPAVPTIVLCVSYLVHLGAHWVLLTSRLVNEIKSLDAQFQQGLEKTLEILPVATDGTETNERNRMQWADGIHRHIRQMHDGIQALTIQNNFIKHLLGEETPPLALWKKEDGRLILANTGFRANWALIGEDGNLLPDWPEFKKFVARYSPVQQAGPRIAVKENGSEPLGGDQLFDISVIRAGKETFHRILVHQIQSSILGFNGIMASFTNVTEIKNLEKIKGEMVNVVSHELKLPLTTIMGYSEMLAESLSGKEVVFAEEICKQAKRLARMIEDFLDIARMESGKYQVKMYPFDPLQIVHDAMCGVLHAAERKKIEVQCELPARTSPLIGDEVLLIQAILNILDNAVKFSPENSMVKLKVEEREQTIEVFIKDQGPGVLEQDLQLIFEKFTRGSDQSKSHGFGLGLNFVKNVIENHSGRISVKNNHDSSGCTFHITLLKKSVSD